ncbi:DUF4336 domain-containing protein [Hyalangium rubrum]|uniref:DUF4336 domain-containing protein n=1 Tax=Hyalangium rubrum TaxID=3103134 RepID=A0ABU5H2G7_9BACT|nr:DUF4336 domain-containing protein [Hyalangium sp. s54d21]MDY7227648.1 DUF4336 domain-containing protein [Hyalangium sp. s54d21]
MLRPLSEGVFVREVPFRTGGMELGGRMTVIRLPDGGLWIHSPVRMDAETRAAVDALGPVRFLVAPNVMHHVHLGDWAAAYPAARVVAPAGLRAKRPDLRIDGELTETPDPGYAAVFTQQRMQGMPRLDEFLFLHRPSRTLLVTDLAFHIRESSSWLTRTYLKLNRTYGKLAPTVLLKSLVKDKAALRTSLEGVLGWDFERVVVCHGEVLERGGREALRDGFAWLQA